METPCCDECGTAVAAKNVVSLPSGRALYFCNHHANKYRVKLEEMGALIYPLLSMEADLAPVEDGD